MRHLAPIALVFTSLAVAQSTPTDKVVTDKVVSGKFGIDFTTQYFFRGILQENQGIIAQPWLELGYGVYDGEASGLHDVGLTFGLWNSLHDGPTGGANGIWYENDFYISLRGKVSERWNVGTTYTSYYSPNGSFPTVQEVAFSAGLDDKGLWLPSLASGLQPSALIAIETDGQADAGSPGNQGVYAQLGVEPAFGLGQLGSLDLTFSVPTTLGLSLNNYYEKAGGAGSSDVFGYLDVGAVVSSALSFLPHGMGPWNAHAGLHFMFLGSNNKERNSGDNTELIFSFGFSTTF